MVEPLFKQLRTPQPNKVSFRTVRYSVKSSNGTGVFHSTVDQRNAYKGINKGESFLENSLMVLLDQDPEVVEYLPQSVPKNLIGEFEPLHYELKDGNMQPWTPDFCVKWKDGEIWIIEVKTISQIYKSKKNLVKLKRKWSEAENICSRNGWKFYVFTDKFNEDSWRVENLVDLESQIEFSSKKCEKIILSTIRKDEKFNWTVQKLQKSLMIDFSNQEILSSTYNLIYENRLFIKDDKLDIKHSRLSLVNDDFASLKKWLLKYHWYNQEKEKELKVVDRNQLTPYQLEQYDRNIAIISEYSKGIHYKEIVKKYGISERTLYRLWNQSQLGSDNVELIPKKQKAGRKHTALFVVNKEGEAEYKDNIFKEVMEEYLQSERPSREVAWTKYTRLLRSEYVNNGLISKPNAAFHKLRKINPDLPSKYIFMKELKRFEKEFKLKVDSSREGFEVANKMNRNVTGSTPYHNYIGQLCQIDHTPSDVLGMIPTSIYVELNEKSKGMKVRSHFMERAIITAVIDVHSRVILGYSFRYEKASKNSTFMALRRTVLGKVSPLYSENDKRKVSTAEKILRVLNELYDLEMITEEGYESILQEFNTEENDNLRSIADWWDNLRVMPRILHMDNGSDFTSLSVSEWAQKYNIQLAIRPVGGSQYGGHIERVLGTLNRNAFYDVPGNTKDSPKTRRNYKSEAKAILTFEQMEALFLLAILRYHVTPHSTLGIPPKQAWDEGVKAGHNLSPLKTDNEMIEFAYNTIDVVKNGNQFPSYYPNQGVQVKNIRYNYEKLVGASQDKSWSTIFSKGDKVEVRWDSSDIRYLWWWNPFLKRPVKVWASKIKIGRREFGRKQLQKFPPIPYLQYKDAYYNDDYYLFNLKEIYEENRNRIDNVIGTTKDAIPRGKISQQKHKKKMRDIERRRVMEKEAKETESYISGSKPKDFHFEDEEGFDESEKKTKILPKIPNQRFTRKKKRIEIKDNKTISSYKRKRKENDD